MVIRVNRGRIMIGNSLRLEPDFAQSTKDMEELVQLSRLSGFDLFIYLRLLSEADAPTLCAYVDSVPAIPTGSRIVRYQLSEGLKVILTALRARNFNPIEIEGGSGSGSMNPDTASPGRFSHLSIPIPLAEDQR